MTLTNVTCYSFSAGLRATAGLLPLIGVSFALGLLLVNQELAMFHYVFAGFTFSQVSGLPFYLSSTFPSRRVQDKCQKTSKFLLVNC